MPIPHQTLSTYANMMRQAIIVMMLDTIMESANPTVNSRPGSAIKGTNNIIRSRLENNLPERTSRQSYQ